MLVLVRSSEAFLCLFVYVFAICLFVVLFVRMVAIVDACSCLLVSGLVLVMLCLLPADLSLSLSLYVFSVAACLKDGLGCHHCGA